MKNYKNALRLSLLLLSLLALLLCTACNTNGADAESTEAATEAPACDAHVASDWVSVRTATCTEKGEMQKTCTVCSTVLETKETDLLPHREEIVKGQAATCTAEGLTDGKKCSVCDTVLIAQTATARKAHTETVIAGRAATCTQEGLTEGKKCTVCNTVTVQQAATDKLTHTEGGWIIDKKATVGEAGQKHTACISCNTTMRTEAIPALDASHTHAGNEWSVTTPATCKAVGLESFLCVCGETVETREIPLADHTERVLPARDATCKAKGLTAGKDCSVCGEVLVAQREIAMTGHTPSTLLGKAPTCDASGLTEGSVCYVCSMPLTSQVVIPPLGHDFFENVCKNCGIPEPQGVWIVDGLGTPVSDVIVRVLLDGEQVKMAAYDGEFLTFTGLDTTKTYTLSLDLSSLGDDYVYDEESAKITPENPSAVIRVYREPSKARGTYFVGGSVQKDYKMYQIYGAGSYLIDLTPNDCTYLIFAPDVAAIYAVTYEADEELSVEYRGMSHYVQDADMTEYTTGFSKYENGIAFSIYTSDLGGDRVIAIRSASATSCVLNIKNAGDPGTRLEDEPWTPYLEDAQTVADQLAMAPTGTYTALDLYDLTLSAHFNEADGYYHLGSVDGPVIYIDLTSDSPYLSSIQTICANQRMGVYVYDEFGGLLEKRSFNELFLQYGMPADSTAPETPVRVPLTERLADAIRTYGEKAGWWKAGSSQNIFTLNRPTDVYNQEYAWLLFCGVFN